MTRGRNPKMDAFLKAVNGSPRFTAKAFLEKQMQGVYGFFGPFRFLSNFHFVDVEYDGVIYRTTEHAYQAAKTLDLTAREIIRQQERPREARRLGQEVVFRPDWEQIKLNVMMELTIQKYAKDPLRSMLLDTGDLYLEETNTWGDVYWGVCGGKGQNNLGKILMEVREHLFALGFGR